MTAKTQTENICENCGHKKKEHITGRGWKGGKNPIGIITECVAGCPCKKFIPRTFKHKIVDVRVLKDEKGLKKAIDEGYFTSRKQDAQKKATTIVSVEKVDKDFFKKNLYKKQDVHGQDVSTRKDERKISKKSFLIHSSPDSRKGNSSPQTKKRIKIRLSEESIKEILDLQEELGLEKSETRENRRMFYSQEWEYLFG